MLNGYETSLEQKLREAEEAEAEVSRLEALAMAAPLLREQYSKAQREADRNKIKTQAMAEARAAMEAATNKQTQIPGTLETVCKVVYSFYSLLREIDAHRRAALQALSKVDRVEYEAELEAGEAAQREVGREPVGLDFVYAARHGDGRVKQMLEELDPSFSYLKNCSLEHPLHRDVANFILAHAIHPKGPTAQQPAAAQPGAGPQ